MVLESPGLEIPAGPQVIPRRHRVVYVSDLLGPHDFRFLERMCGQGHAMTLVTFNGDIAHPHFKASGYDVRRIPGLDIRHRVDLAGHGWGLLWKRLRFLRFVLAEVRPDVLHAGWVQTSGLISVGSGFHPLLLMPIGSDVLIEPFTTWRAKRLARFVLRRGDLVTVDADSMKRAVMAASGLPSEKVVMIPWGVDVGRFSLDYDAEACKRAMGWAGRKVVLKNRTHRPVYGHADFLRAMALVAARVPDLLVVIGSYGPLDGDLRALAASLGIADRCVWPGYLDAETFRTVLRACDVYVNASHSDGVSASVQEALSSGKALVITDIEGHRQWLEPDVHALYFPVGDPGALAKQVTILLTQETWRRKLEEGVRAYDRSFIDRDRRIDQIAELYDVLVG
jgi:glycosyltransferase involved in cell wall biosynthesis